MIARTHYDRDQLTDFLNEDSGATSNRIAAHLETCPSCQEVLESLAEADFDWRGTADLLSGDHTFATKHGHDDGYYAELTARLLEASSQPNSIGRFGRYEIVRFIGRGGMGIVMEGIDSALDRRCAIKVLAPELASSAAARRRFSREAKSAAAVVHAHVVPIQTVDEFKGMPYLVMPVVDGQSLQRRVDDQGPLSVIETVRIAAQVAAGLAAAHAQGLVHRDIKPANILLENGVERVQLTDFGLARASDDANMTRSGVIAGTPQYMSPEQAHGDDIDYRSDLFSLGCTMYFMLTGRSPFRAETTMGVLNRIINDPPRPLHAINADVPQWLAAIVMRLLEKKREDRFQTAEETSQLLAGWLAHLQSPASVRAPKCSELQKYYASGQFGSTDNGGGTIRWIAGLALGGFALWLGVMIVLETNKGTLRIESNSDASVPIRILQDGQTVEQLTVSKEGTATRLRAGQYTIELGYGVSGYEIDNDKVTLLRGKDWVAKVELSKTNQDTATQKMSTSDRYMRVPIEGPTTSEGAIQAIDPPSDAEVLAALKDELHRRGEDATWVPTDSPGVRIVKEKIVDFVDPIRTLPLVGDSQLHHAHYKCTIYFHDPKLAEKSTEAAKVEVVFIDNYHLHVAKNAVTPAAVSPIGGGKFTGNGVAIEKSNAADSQVKDESSVDSAIRITLEGDPNVFWLVEDNPSKIEALGFSFNLDNISRTIHFNLLNSKMNIIAARINLECDVSDESLRKSIQGKKVSLRISAEEASDAANGAFIKKVLYLAGNQDNENSQELLSISSQKVNPAMNVLTEANRLGQAVVSFTLSNQREPTTLPNLTIVNLALKSLIKEVVSLEQNIKDLPDEDKGQARDKLQNDLNLKRALASRLSALANGTLGSDGSSSVSRANLIWKSDSSVCLNDQFASELKLDVGQIAMINNLISNAWQEYKELEREQTKATRNKDGSLEILAHVIPEKRSELIKKYGQKISEVVSAENRRWIMLAILNVRPHNDGQDPYIKAEDAYPSVFGWNNQYPVRLNISSSGTQLQWKVTPGKYGVTGVGLSLPPELIHYMSIETQGDILHN